MANTRQQFSDGDDDHPNPEPKGPVRRGASLAFAIRLVELIAGRIEPVTAAELAATSGVAGARLQRGLNALMDIGLISQDAEETYSLAARSAYLAALIRNIRNR